MDPRFKRILVILGFILVTVGIGFLLYRVFFQPTAPSRPTSTGPGTLSGQLPSANTGQPGGTSTGVIPPGGLPSANGTQPGQLTLPSNPSTNRTTTLVPTVTRAISANPSGAGVRSYNPNDGKFYRIADDGSAVPLSNQVFYNVNQVTWGNRTDKAILSYPDGSKILYDFNTNQQATLPKHWEDFEFSPQDDRIAAKSVGNNENNRFLVTANPDGTNAKAVEDLGNNQDKAHVSWSPNNQIIAYSFTGDPLGYDRQAIILVGQNQENFKSLIVEGRGFIPNWSPSGDTVLYSVYNSTEGYLPKIWVSGASGDNINNNRRSLELNTWADKCVWQNEASLICAVPTQLETGAGLQRAIANGVPDSIYKINLQNGEKINLGVPKGNPTVGQITLSKDGSAVYYTDLNTGALSRFSL